MATRRIFGLPPLAVIGAALIGFLFGSYDRIATTAAARDKDVQERLATTEQPTRRSSTTRYLEATHATAGHGSTPATPQDQRLEDFTIRASKGLLIQPSRIDGRFVGYAIVENGGESRFTPGSIIVAVNGIPVEDSAAGGELLIAALAGEEPNIVYYSTDE